MDLTVFVWWQSVHAHVWYVTLFICLHVIIVEIIYSFQVLQAYLVLVEKFVFFYGYQLIGS